MKFEIESFKQLDGTGKVKAFFSAKTEGGMYYDMKLVEGGATGFFAVSNQSRSYDDRDGNKKYINAFGALKGTPAARFFDDVATQAAAQLKVEQVMGQEEPQCTQQPDCPCPTCGIPF